MNQETANYIMQRMSKYLDNSQMIKLKHTLDGSLRQSEDGGRKRVHRNFWILQYLTPRSCIKYKRR